MNSAGRPGSSRAPGGDGARWRRRSEGRRKGLGSSPGAQLSGREERIGLNEAVFREVNERIEEVADTFDIQSQPLDLICECGDAKCVEPLSMSRAEYEHIRSDPQTFAVHPGHELPDVEDVVERRKAYNIVRKGQGTPEEIAERTDPRSR